MRILDFGYTVLTLDIYKEYFFHNKQNYNKKESIILFISYSKLRFIQVG